MFCGAGFSACRLAFQRVHRRLKGGGRQDWLPHNATMKNPRNTLGFILVINRLKDFFEETYETL